MASWLQEEEEGIGDVDLFTLVDDGMRLAVNAKWLGHLAERQLGEDGHPRKVTARFTARAFMSVRDMAHVVSRFTCCASTSAGRPKGGPAQDGAGAGVGVRHHRVNR